MAKINFLKKNSSKKGKETKLDEPSYADGEFTPTLPVSNLIPSLVLTNRSKEKTIFRIFLNIFFIVIFFALAWGGSFAYSSFQQLNEGNIESQLAELETEKQELLGYELRKSYIDELKMTGTRLFNSKIDMALAFKHVAEAADNNDVIISSFTVTGTEASEQNSCTSSSPFEPISQIGCISISASTAGGGVNGFLNSLLDINGFFSESSSAEGIYKSYMSGILYNDEGTITFTIKIPVTIELLSNRNSYFGEEYDVLLKEAESVLASDNSDSDKSVKEWLDQLLNSSNNAVVPQQPSEEDVIDVNQPSQPEPVGGN